MKKVYILLLVLPTLIPLQLIWCFRDPKFAPGVLCALPWARSLSHLPAWNASSYSPNTSPKLHRCKVPKKRLWKHLLEFCNRKNEKEVFCYHDSNVKSIDSMILVLPRWNLQIHCGTELNGLSTQFTAGHLTPWHVGRWKVGGGNKLLTMEVVFWWALVHLPTRSWASQTPALECHDPHCLVSSESLEENPRCYSLLPWFKNVKNPL